MFNLQGSEIIVILLIALVVLGPERLPDAIRRFMQTYNELKKMGSGFQSEIKTAFEEPLREMRDTAAVVRDAADPAKFLAEAEAEQRLRDDAAAAGEPTPIVDPSNNGHGPGDRANGWDRPQVPVVDPGSETVATPGSSPSSPSSSPASPPPPPPPPPPPAGIPASTVDPPPLPRDVEQTDRDTLQRGRPGDAGALGDRALAGRIEDRGAHGAQYVTARVTGFDPTSPFAHPPMISENSPAPPPA